MFTFNNKGVHFNTKYLSAFVVNKPVYNVNLVQTQGGTINASPLTGYENTEVTLSNTPDTDYEFDSYSLTGATLYDSNKFILNNDVTAQATWTYVPPPTPPDEVVIGSATWKAQDLAVDDGGSGIYIRNNVTVNGVNLGTKYYYTWDAARRVASSIEGWHLPTEADRSYFINYVYNSSPFDEENFGRKTRSLSGWTNNMNGWGTFDFNSEPAGFLSGQNYNNMNLVLTGIDNEFWVNSSAWYYDEYDYGDFIYYVSALGYGSVYNRYSAYTNYPNIISTDSKYTLVKTWLSNSPTVTSTEQPMALTVRLVKDVPVPQPPLSANTIRVKFKSGYTPNQYVGDTQTLVDADENIWDIYEESNDWSYLFVRNFNLLDVISANTTNVVNMYFMFSGCTALSSVQLFDTTNVTGMDGTFCKCTNLSTVPLFDTSNVKTMLSMFNQCTNLTSVPLFDTSNVTSMNSTFSNCSNLTDIPLFDTSNVRNFGSTFSRCSSLSCSVPLFNTNKATNTQSMFDRCDNMQSGALALYQQMSTQTTPPSSHSNTFWFCGRNTVAGYAELQQIPSAWGGFGPNT